MSTRINSSTRRQFKYDEKKEIEQLLANQRDLIDLASRKKLLPYLQSNYNTLLQQEELEDAKKFIRSSVSPVVKNRIDTLEKKVSLLCRDMRDMKQLVKINEMNLESNTNGKKDSIFQIFNKLERL